MTRIAIAIAALVAVFGWGMVAGAYEVFPYQIFRAAKNFAEGENGEEKEPPPRPYVANPDSAEAASGDALWGTRGDIVMIGDSITASGRWEEMFPDRAIVNRGVGGDTVAGVLERLPVFMQVEPKQAFIMVGINDSFIGNANEDVLARYEEIVRTLVAANVDTYVQSTLMCRESPICPAERRARIDALNTMLEAMAEKQGARFIDLNARMADSDGLKDELTWDGLHLNGRGYSLWRELLAPHITGRGAAAPDSET